MKQLSFKVSAKTARLFGRENVSNAEGAISELVKNTYDADAGICLVCFFRRYDSAPPKLSKQEFDYLHRNTKSIELFYIENGDEYYRTVASGHADFGIANQLARSLIDLWIIDNGSGMSGDAIEEHWMVIGTNNKEDNVISEGGRTRTGAKGIGRFALDRLGSSCELYSSSVCREDDEDVKQSILWKVDWSDFEVAGKVLDDIKATLVRDARPFEEAISSIVENATISSAIIDQVGESFCWNTGTAIRIGLLRDPWTRSDLDHLYKTLGELIPPLGQRALNLYLYDGSELTSFGLVSPEVLDDYDYKLEAAIGSDGNVLIDLYRNELNYERLDSELFDLEEMQKTPFEKKAFQQEKVTYSKSIDELFPGAPENFKKNAKELGPFKVDLLFYKKGNPSQDDIKIYPYRAFQPGPRKAWLEKFGGLKIYRDNFAVRPYGELDGRAFDWLSLGQRVAISPVAASRKGWKVSPQNLAGTVTISRQQNARLNDQSNREGIIDNNYFSVFREIIKRIIQEFEDDRSHIHSNINKLYQSKNQSEQAKSEGALTAERVSKRPERATPADAKQLAKAFVAQQEEIKELRDEQTMLRALATLGTVLVSFSHEMGQLQNSISSRSAELSDILTSYIDPDKLVGVGGAFNPYTILEEWEEDDKKVKQWFTFALSSIRADKRRRRKISLRDHLEKARAIWMGFLGPREIELNLIFNDDGSDPKVLAFEIDLDSIFNNLILNSVEALLSPKHKGLRRIDVCVSVVGSKVKIDYRDNGPGIDAAIKDPASIFRFAVTTKLDGSGVASGTGLGMWILAAVVQSYKGSCKAYRAKNGGGFNIEILLPLTA